MHVSIALARFVPSLARLNCPHFNCQLYIFYFIPHICSLTFRFIPLHKLFNEFPISLLHPFAQTFQQIFYLTINDSASMNSILKSNVPDLNGFNHGWKIGGGSDFNGLGSISTAINLKYKSPKFNNAHRPHSPSLQKISTPTPSIHCCRMTHILQIFSFYSTFINFFFNFCF
ncbi:unnamed protein product [Camellia sinensis]